MKQESYLDKNEQKKIMETNNTPQKINEKATVASPVGNKVAQEAEFKPLPEPKYGKSLIEELVEVEDKLHLSSLISELSYELSSKSILLFACKEGRKFIKRVIETCRQDGDVYKFFYEFNQILMKSISQTNYSEISQFGHLPIDYRADAVNSIINENPAEIEQELFN